MKLLLMEVLVSCKTDCIATSVMSSCFMCFVYSDTPYYVANNWKQESNEQELSKCFAFLPIHTLLNSVFLMSYFTLVVCLSSLMLCCFQLYP